MNTTKGWTEDRYTNSTNILRREGLVWVDKKTGTSETHLYFPSMLTKLAEFKSQFKRI